MNNSVVAKVKLYVADFVSSCSHEELSEVCAVLLPSCSHRELLKVYAVLWGRDEDYYTCLQEIEAADTK